MGEILYENPIRCRGKDGTDKEGVLGFLHALVFIGDRYWAVIVWDNEDDPDLYKAELVEVSSTTWSSLHSPF